MGHRTTGNSTGRGNRRTRGGAGRHNLSGAAVRSPSARIRICLGCNRAFKSRGPWNRLCGRCHLHEDEELSVTTYRIPGEWPAAVIRDADDMG